MPRMITKHTRIERQQEIVAGTSEQFINMRNRAQ